MKMAVVESSDELIHVSLDGRLDNEGVDAIEVMFNATIGSRRKNALLDFSNVTFLSTVGIRMIESMARITAKSGGQFLLMNPQPLVLETIKMASLEELTPVVDSLEDATNILKS